MKVEEKLLGLGVNCIQLIYCKLNCRVETVDDI